MNDFRGRASIQAVRDVKNLLENNMRIPLTDHRPALADPATSYSLKPWPPGDRVGNCRMAGSSVIKQISRRRRAEASRSRSVRNRSLSRCARREVVLCRFVDRANAGRVQFDARLRSIGSPGLWKAQHTEPMSGAPRRHVSQIEILHS
jgi:hypothetical protein